jgi:hypothetical protein
MRYRTYIPSIRRRRFRTGPSEEAGTNGEDGEEPDAQHGAG